MKNRRNTYAASTSSAIPFPSASQRPSTVFSINGSNINHANLRRHLDPNEQQPLQDTPPLIRQGAFMFDDSVGPVCRICYGVTEDQENGHFIRPCQCRGSMYVNNHSYLQPSSPPIPSTSTSSSISHHHHHSLFPPSPHQEFHDIPDNNNNNNNNNNLLLLHNNNNNDSGNVHDKCLNSWLTSVNPTTQKCSTCLYEFTFPPTSTLQPNNDQYQRTQHYNSLNTAESSSSSSSSHLLSPPPPLFTLPTLSSSTSSSKKQLGIKEYFKSIRYGLYTIGIIFLLSFGTVSIRCTEIRKISGTEIDGNSEAPLGRPDHIYLPIVNWECWRSSFFGQIYFSLWSPYFIIYIPFCISILYLLMNRFHQIPSTTR